MSEKKEYIEPEVLDKNFNKQKENFREDFNANHEDPISQLKSMLVMRGIMTLIFPIIIFLLILGLIISFLFWILPSVIALILVGVFLAFLVNLGIKIVRIFKG